MNSPRPDMIHRRHGAPMLCPLCGNDVWADAPHVCPEGFVAPARRVLTFYGYNSLNQCCRSWMLMGWPQEFGQPCRTEYFGIDDYGRIRLDCPKCDKWLWFDIAHPDIEIHWDEAERGKPQPPALVGGRIKVSSNGSLM